MYFLDHLQKNDDTFSFVRTGCRCNVERRSWLEILFSQSVQWFGSSWVRVVDTKSCRPISWNETDGEDHGGDNMFRSTDG